VLTIGLTGGIGSGKSTVSARLAELGAVVVDADRLAREVVEPGTDGLAEVVATFGPEVLGPGGALDRAALGRVVFGDDERRRALEKIIHPRVRERTIAIVSTAAPDAVLVNDIPLLVEIGTAGSYDLVIVVLAREENRIARLLASRGMSEEEARTRIAAQATDEQRRAVADIVIENDGSREGLLAEVDRVWRDVIVPRAAARG
jgi:dephospho-CoA kinase